MPVIPDHVVKHLLVAALLEGVQRDRLADQWIGDRIGETLHRERVTPSVWTAMLQNGRPVRRASCGVQRRPRE
jgi:hypothetical protein